MPITPNDPADFGPTLGNYTELKPFRYWCQKVLPLVYDDALSYYELLCKVVDYLNKTMEDVETLHEDVNALNKAYTKLQNYVNNYFSSLDVQQEINNKLDEMANDGTLMSLLNGHFMPSGNCNLSIAQKLYKVGMSYFENNYINLIYAHLNEGGNAMDYQNGPTYGYSVESPAHQGYYINCACLTNLMLLGTPYQYSMYNTQNGLHNKIGVGGYKSLLIPDINSETYTQINYTSAMAKKFREKGQGFWCSYPYNDVQIGDVLFFFNEDSGTGDRLNDIKHCDIVVSVSPNDGSNDETCTVFTTIDATEGDHPVSIRHWELNDLTNFTSDNLLYIGRPIYSETGASATPELLGVYDTVSTQTTINNLNLVGGRILIIDFDYTPSANGEYVSVSINGGEVPYMSRNATTANTNMIGKTIHMQIPISLNLLGNDTKLETLTITCKGGSYEDIRLIKIYNGVMGSLQTEFYTVNSINDILDIALKNNNSYIEIQVPSTITVNEYSIDYGYYMVNTVKSSSGSIISLKSYTHCFEIYYDGSNITFVSGTNTGPKTYSIEDVYSLPNIIGAINARINFSSESYSTGYILLLGTKALFISTIGIYIVDKSNNKYKLIGSFDE